MTVLAYARHRHVGRRTVQRALQEGRIRRGSDGLIDPVAADRAWAAHTRQHAPIAEATVVDLEEARRRRALADAERHELEVARLRSELVSRARALHTAHEFARALRESCQTWPVRIGAALATAFELDTHAVTTLLEDQVRDLLTELANHRVAF
jgi:predicted polyphosphate/ATP-dependent NAD kinase